jgi:outer membrane protein assembly factor BamD
MRKKLFHSLLVLVLFSTGCSREGEQTDTRSSSAIIYDRAAKAMADENYRNATNYLEVLTTSFPFSNEAKQAQLDLIFAYYRSNAMEEAIDEAKQFEKENPTHPRVDYALYMRGLALFEGQHSWYHEFFNVDLAKRPPSNTEEAFSIFSQLIRRYPDSSYVDDATQRMIFLRNRLAKYENHVAQHYMERGAYVAAANRAKYSLEQYSGAPETVKSLEIITRAYEKLGMMDLADQAREIYALNIPEDYESELAGDYEKPWYQLW